MDTPGSPESERARKRRRVACSQCRQSKLRCAEEETPCPRCKRLGLDCTKDPSYKRVNRQSKIEELEHHVQRLRGMVEGQSDSATPPALVAFCNTTNTGREHGRQITEGVPFDCPQITNGKPQQLQPQGPSLPYGSLGSVTLDRSQINSLFLIFFEQYHHFLPFLEPSRTPEQYYQSSALLFWSIIAVAGRQYRADTSLLVQLTLPMTELIWNTVASNPMDLATVQALILICTWPLPTVRMWNDASLVCANIALTTSQHLGLHRTAFQDEYPKIKNELLQVDMLERARTWAACVVMCQCLSVDFGHVPSVIFDWTINRACQVNGGFDLPRELRDNLIIQRCSNKAFLALSRNDEDPLGLPPDTQRYAIMEALENDIDAIAQELGPALSFMNKLRLQAVRMYLQAIYFVDESPGPLRKAGILRAYSSASSLLSYILSEQNAHELLSHAPLNTFRTILCAASILWKVLNSIYAKELEYGAGKVLFNAAAFALRQVSVQYHEKDIPARAADGMNLLWRCSESTPVLSDQEPTLRVKSRMGSSLIYDCVLTMRDYKRSEAILAKPMEKDSTAKAAYPVLEQTPWASVQPMSNGLSHLSSKNDGQRWDDMSDLDWLWDYSYPGMYDI